MISLRLFVSCVIMTFLFGCEPSKSKPKDPSIPVKGVVKLNGKPLPGGQITFHGEGNKAQKFPGALTGMANTIWPCPPAPTR